MRPLLLFLLLSLPGAASLKGYEIYSWILQEKWVYVLVPGTNRNKSWAEIQRQPRLSREQFEHQLGQIPAGQYLTWMKDCQGDHHLELPPASERPAWLAFCKERGLKLQW